MSILDDAIREHLELKRAHGADEAEVKRLEDEAFGPPQRPDEHDPFAEAPTEFLVAPEVGAGEQPDEEGRRVPNIADLQEAPESRQEPEPASAAEADDGPAEEEHPAMEHEAIADPGHSTEERHAIAEQPTEMFDVEGQFEDAATESDASSNEDEPADEFDEFFSEQRLSDELNQALEAPLPDEPVLAPSEEGTAEHGLTPTEEGAAPFDPEADLAGEAEAEEDEPDLTGGHELATPEAPPEAEDDPAAPPGSSHEDVLEDTPEFLEDAPEDDELWFEQKPPKDFDFDD